MATLVGLLTSPLSGKIISFSRFEQHPRPRARVPEMFPYIKYDVRDIVMDLPKNKAWSNRSTSYWPIPRAQVIVNTKVLVTFT